jgi:hypothetical protein
MRIRLNRTLREDGFTDPNDVLAIKEAFYKTGHYNTPDYGITPYPDRSLFQAIRAYQKDKNLRVDGVMYPDGPTLKSLNQKTEDPGVKTPRIRCPMCGGLHGGVYGEICQFCILK